MTPQATPQATTQAQFQALVAELTATVAGRPLNEELARELNTRHAPGTPTYDGLRQACLDGVAQGWMCEREAGGIRYGRVIKASPATHDFSVDVVDMNDVVGPHHRHPQGEIDLVMPLEGDARFDGQGAGWVVYGPDTAHKPTVKGGRALVLYLLPEGAIEFTRSAPREASGAASGAASSAASGAPASTTPAR